MKNYRLLALTVLSAFTACGGDDHGAASPCRGTQCDAATQSSATRADGGASARADAGTSARDAGNAQGPSGTSADASSGTAHGDAGSADGNDAPSGTNKASAGCGKPAPAAGDQMIDVSGTAREFILALPKNYDVNTPHKLVFAWHGLGGSAAQIQQLAFYGLAPQSGDSTIYVAGQGLETSNSVGAGPGWDNMNGRDVAFVKALYAQLQDTLCIDESRVFSVGMSYGGIMSDTLGCQMGDVFRAIAPMSGEGPGYGAYKPKCVGQVAVWLSHGNNDTTVPTAQGEASRDYWVGANHCQNTSKPVDPSPCVAYDGCDSGFPVTWCEFTGGHTVPTFASKAIWAFFSQF